MPKVFLKGLLLGAVMIAISGCAVKGGVTVRSYIEDRPRIDQNLEGNAGYIMGTPPVADRSQYKNTRKVYVMEFTKEVDDIPEDEVKKEIPPPVEYTTPPQEESRPRGIVLPSFEDTAREDASATTGGPAEYTVQKNDTLQKISKKFYNSYSKWNRIYQANKEKIPNPDRIKEGLILQIPME